MVAPEIKTNKLVLPRKIDTDIVGLKDIGDSSTETKNWTQEKASCWHQKS